MKVKVIMDFKDLDNNVSRKVGEEFECSEERAKFLVEHKAVEIIEEKVEETVEKVEEPVENKKIFKVSRKNKKK